MRRLLRILFNLATLLSLVLLVATAGLWVRGARTSDWLRLNADGRQYLITSTAGRFEWLNAPLPPEPGEQRPFPLLTSKYNQEQGSSAPSPPAPAIAASRAARPWHWAIGQYPTADHYQFPCDWQVGGLGRYPIMMADHPSNVYASATVWVLSYASVCTAASALPIFGLFRWRRGRRPRPVTTTCCPKCGYDLRATPDRCPECGAFPTTKDATLSKREPDGAE